MCVCYLKEYAYVIHPLICHILSNIFLMLAKTYFLITSNSQNVHNTVQSVMHFNHLILPRYTRRYLADTNMIVTLLMRSLCLRAVK